MNRILVIATVSLMLLSSAHTGRTATISTDGNYATAIYGLQVPGRGTYSVDFVFDSFDDLFGSATAPNPLPTFWNDTAGGLAAMTAIATELNTLGGLVGVKDDANAVTTVDASTGTYNASTAAVVETVVYSTGTNTWITLSNTAFGGNVDFMNAIFTQVPEPATGSLAALAALLLLAARRRFAGSL